MPQTLTPIEKVIYTGKLHTTGGRDGGRSVAADGRLDVKLAPHGGKGEGTNPELLFGAAWSACYLSALKGVAAKAKVQVPDDAAVDIEVDVGTTDGQYLLQARFQVSLPGIDHATGQRLVDEAHRQCPFSKATHGNISVETTLAPDGSGAAQ